MRRRVVVLTFLAYFGATAQQAAVAVPYVGCKSDGMVGPSEAPTGEPKEIRIPAAIAQRLAYYEAAPASGVLGPRGCYCFGYYGSSGATLYISLRAIPEGGPDLSGPLILLEARSAETSGRFDVAAIAARVFPAHRDFVTRILAEGIASGLSFPTGPYPKDKLSYKTAEIVEYETPPQTDGLGTYAGLKKNAEPIRGVAMLVPPAFDLILLAVRLPADLRKLAPAIVTQLDCCSTTGRR